MEQLFLDNYSNQAKHTSTKPPNMCYLPPAQVPDNWLLFTSTTFLSRLIQLGTTKCVSFFCLDLNFGLPWSIPALLTAKLHLWVSVDRKQIKLLYIRCNYSAGKGKQRHHPQHKPNQKERWKSYSCNSRCRRLTPFSASDFNGA